MTSILFKLGQKVIPKRIRPSIGLFYYKLTNILKYHTTDFFMAVEIEINTSCNRRCSYCPNSIYDRGKVTNPKYIKTESFKKVIDELSDLDFNGRLSPHFYGEPLLDERLTNLMEYARKKLPKANIVIYTNGDLLSIDKYEELVKAGVDAFTITEHSPSMLTNIKKLFDYRKEHKQKKPTIIYTDLKSSQNLSTRAGLVDIKTNAVLEKCLMPSENITIDYNGNVILCCNDYFSSMKWGNVNNEKLIDIWKKPNYKKLRKELRKEIFKFPICIKCKNDKK